MAGYNPNISKWYKNKPYYLVATCTSLACLRRVHPDKKFTSGCIQYTVLWDIENLGVNDCPYCGYSLHWKRYHPKSKRFAYN